MLAYTAADFATSESRYARSTRCLNDHPQPLRFATADLDRLFAGLGECLQLTPGVFNGRGRRVNVQSARITDLELNCGVQINGLVESERLHLLILRPSQGSRALVNAIECTGPTCLVISGKELSVNILGAASLLWFDIARAALEPDAQAFAPARAVLELSALERGLLVNYAANRLADEREGTIAPDAFDGGTLDRAIRGVAASLLERAHAHLDSRADASREKLIRRAQDLMGASIEEPPTLREICTAAKCSVRSLIYAFNASFGMSPMKYFKIHRLNAAHRKFRSASPGTHIFDVAADCGFWHLGHFGADYKTLFGTTPKATPAHPKPAVSGPCERRECAGFWCV